MRFSTKVMTLNAAVKGKRLNDIFEYMEQHNDEQAKLAKKEVKRFSIITVLIFLAIIVLFAYTMLLVDKEDKEYKKYPDGATIEKRGHISLYEDTFWYTDSNKKYEFDFEDYDIDNSYEPGEIILIYLDDNNNIVDIRHQSNESSINAAIKLGLMFFVAITVVLCHAFIGKKIYARNWELYLKWYEKEIEPYCYQENFEELVANKKYYDVTINDLNIDKQSMYKKYRNREIIYTLLFFVGAALIIYFYNKFNLTPKSWIGFGIIFIYVIFFGILIDNCKVEMHRIKTGYYDKKKEVQ